MHTERIFELINRLNTTESNLSSGINGDRILERNTIEELLKTDSDSSPFILPFKERSGTPEHDMDDQLPFFMHKTDGDRPDTADFIKTDEDCDQLCDTQELLKTDFEEVIRRHCGFMPIDKEESKEISEKENESTFTFRPKSSTQFPSKGDMDSPPNEIIETEVDLIENSNLESPHKRPGAMNEKEKIAIAEDILSTLIREIQECPFPLRIVPHENDNLSKYDAKYREKAVFHLNPVPENIDNSDSDDHFKILAHGEGDTDESADIEDEIMMNFNIIRNFEMKRTRAEKNQYDHKVFTDYITEVF